MIIKGAQKGCSTTELAALAMITPYRLEKCIALLIENQLVVPDLVSNHFVTTKKGNMLLNLTDEKKGF